MMTWCRKFVLLLALAVTPLQGIAATAALLRCHTDSTGHAPHMMHTQDGHSHDHDTNHDEHPGHDNDGGTGTQAAGHFCFHHFASALPVVALPAAAPGFHVRASTSLTLHDLFIPERPQRPPLG